MKTKDNMKIQLKNMNKYKDIKKNQKNSINKIKSKVKQNQQNLIIKNQNGITLLALIVTIIVLLILAGITIGVITGDNGIIGKAISSKEQSEIANEKEILEKATVEAMGKDKYGNLKESELQKQLDKETGEGKTLASDIGKEFEVLFNESNRYYIVDKDGNIGEMQEIVKDKNPGDITVGKDGEILDGSKERPFEIWCIEDLVAFSNMVNGEGIKIEDGKAEQITQLKTFRNEYVALKTNLNFKSRLSYENSERTDFGDINGNSEDGNTLMNEMTTGTGFKPIGLRQNDGERTFNGDFNGENNKIDNIFIKCEREYVSVGLFGDGNEKYTEISNLEVSGEIRGSWHTGGIIGEEVKNISNCINRASITGYNIVGGIVGLCRNNEKIENCKNYGEINTTGIEYSYGGTGGIAGNANNIENCKNYGEIGKTSNTNNGNQAFGGIIGYGSTIKNCKNEGKIGTIMKGSASIVIAGISGKVQNSGEIINCENIGEVSGYGIIGGIVGGVGGGSWDQIINVKISNCTNRGILKNSRDRTGGILGEIGVIYKEFTIEFKNLYNTAELETGIVGYIPYDLYNSPILNVNFTNVYDCNDIHLKMANGVTYTGDIEKKTQEEMKSQDFIDNILNKYIKENNLESQGWRLWKSGKDGYPTFE